MHKISIPKEIIDACIKRRGKQHVFDTIDPRKTTLKGSLQIMINQDNNKIYVEFSEKDT